MSKKIYIIGNSDKKINVDIENSYHLAQLRLFKMGFTVINPVQRILSGISIIDAKKKNMQDLIASDAVYIMPCVDVKNSVEIKLALNFNLIIISSFFDIPLHSDLMFEKSYANK